MPKASIVRSLGTAGMSDLRGIPQPCVETVRRPKIHTGTHLQLTTVHAFYKKRLDHCIVSTMNRHANCKIPRIGQLNLQNSKEATSQARVIMERHFLDIMMMQEPYSLRGKLIGFGGDFSVAGNKDTHEGRPMAAIVMNQLLKPKEMNQFGDRHFVVTQFGSPIGEIFIISSYFQFGHAIDGYVENLDMILLSLS